MRTTDFRGMHSAMNAVDRIMFSELRTPHPPQGILEYNVFRYARYQGMRVPSSFSRAVLVSRLSHHAHVPIVGQYGSIAQITEAHVVPTRGWKTATAMSGLRCIGWH